MTQKEMECRMISIGLGKKYDVRWDMDDRGGVIYFNTRNPVKIINGNLVGTEIVLQDKILYITTSQSRKAARLCKERGIKLKKYADCSEFNVRAGIGDDFLPALGAKIKTKAAKKCRG